MSIVAVSPSPHLTSPRMPGERVTVVLIPAVSEDLHRLHRRTKLSATDLTNRAITLYEFFDAQLRAGNDLMVRNGGTGRIDLVRFC